MGIILLYGVFSRLACQKAPAEDCTSRPGRRHSGGGPQRQPNVERCACRNPTDSCSCLTACVCNNKEGGYPSESTTSSYNCYWQINKVSITCLPAWTSYYESMGIFASIFKTEVHTIYLCLERILDRNHSVQNIAILSESEAAIGALRSPVINFKVVSECLRKLNDLGRRNKVSILWVPGQVGLQGRMKKQTNWRR